MKVSVSMITYNHEKYIAEAIESVLMQDVDFTYEIVVGEDCSKDRTRQILLHYQRRYPDKFRLLLNDVNLGMLPNFVQTLQACRGQYIALLEGDDYWTDPLKLQKQVAFLDKHHDCVMCFHGYKTARDDGNTKATSIHRHGRKHTYNLKDILRTKTRKFFVRTNTQMFRNGLLTDFPDWFYDMPMGDYPHTILLAQHGTIGYIDGIMSVYRVHEGAAWSQADAEEDLKRLINAEKILLVNLQNEHRKHLRASLYQMYNDLLKVYVARGDKINQKRYAKRGVIGYYYCKGKSLEGLLRLLLSMYCPSLLEVFRWLKRRLRQNQFESL